VWGPGVEMNQPLYANMNNKRKMKKKKELEENAQEAMWKEQSESRERTRTGMHTYHCYQ
jgi:hypothetical protein